MCEDFMNFFFTFFLHLQKTPRMAVISADCLEVRNKKKKHLREHSTLFFFFFFNITIYIEERGRELIKKEKQNKKKKTEPEFRDGLQR